MTGHYKTLLNI